MRAASREHRRRIGALHEDELGEAERQEADPAGSPEFTAEANAPETSSAEGGTGSGFLYLDGP
ncbi:MAG TPA: hypothetical protein VGG86_15855 [Roseiarcus sp.]|jgi:hypothetical protein